MPIYNRHRLKISLIDIWAIEEISREGEAMLNPTTTENKRVVSIGAAFIACTIVAFLIAAIAMFATPEKAYASFKSSSSTTSTITITWDDAYANSTYNKTQAYAIAWVDSLEANDQSKIKTQGISAGINSYTITGLKPGTKYRVEVARAYYDANNDIQVRTVGWDYSLSTRVVKPTGVKQTKWSYKDNKAYFTWDIQTGASQVQCKLVNVANGKTYLDKTFSSLARDFYVWGMRTDMMFAVQMRVKDANGWSPWSDKMYFLSQPLTNYKTKVANNKLTVGWNKVKGAQKYTIYVSTKAKSGYKKVGTAKSTKSSMVFKKFKGQKFSPKKTYYVYVQATKKVGGKTFTSGKHYAYKVKGASGKMAYPF